MNTFFPSNLSISDRLKKLREEIQGYSPLIVAVTKYAEPARMIEAFEAGLRDFGENRVQDALQKQALLPADIVRQTRWHFIGRLQQNKVKKIIGRFSLIHSIDSIPLAEEISKRHLETGNPDPQSLLLQVNISGESTKQGFFTDELADAINSISALQGLHIRGFMTIAPRVSEQAQADDSGRIARQVFCQLRQLKEAMESETGRQYPELSMGMSQDYMPALVCGATIIRIGSHFFGDPLKK